MSKICTKLNVKRTMTYLENAVNMINELSDQKYFSKDTEVDDLKNQLGMTDDDIEIYQYRNDMADDLIVPIAFIKEDGKIDAKIDVTGLDLDIITVS